jgi:hypothetical protein
VKVADVTDLDLIREAYEERAAVAFREIAMRCCQGITVKPLNSEEYLAWLLR